MKQIRLLILITFFLVFAILVEAFAGDNQYKTVPWQKWEHFLTSQKNYPGRPASLEVIFTGPGGITFHTPAYTDDGKLFHFRAAFPSPGKWQWKTICSDSANGYLHNRVGKVNVKTYSGDNPLFRHGDLKVSDNRRYLIHADGTPFLWIGETGWNATLKSTMKEWCDYVDKRASQRFSVLQISPRGVGNKKTASAMETISVKKDGTPDPLFWKDLEDKIAYANAKGLYVLMVGVGRAWRDLFSENTHNQPFETYVAGRFAGYMVSFSPSFDQLYDPANDSIAMNLKKLTLHLVTQHPGTNYDANLKYRNSSSVDFCGLQSGHNGGNLIKAYNAARSWTLDMWNGSPVKPVIDIEAMYDGYGNNNAKNWREKDVRKLGWIAWLSGSRGYTYGAGDIPPKVPAGAGGVWKFNKDSTGYDYWRKAIMWPSAGQMTIMRDFFDSIEWWKLVPAQELIQNQAEDETLKMVISITIEKGLLLAYLPDNPVIKLDLSGFSGTLKGKWINPVSGSYIYVDHPIMPESEVSFSRPEGWEDALLLLGKV